MPITGFLEGFNEQRQVEQKLEDQRQLAGLRATEIAANVNKLQTDYAVKSTLAGIFMGPSPSERDPNASQDDVLADRMQRAGAAVMAVDPVKGLAFTNAAANIQQRKALAKKEQLEGDIKARDEQGGYLAAMKDQESYDTLLPKALQAGWKLPSWFTGDYAKDGPKIAAEAAGTMKASEQATVQKNLANERIALERNQRIAEAASAKAEIDTMKLALQQQARDTANKAEDRRQAQGRERLNRQALPNDADLRAAKDLFESQPDIPTDFNPSAKKEIIHRVATEAKRNALRNDTDIDEEMNKSLERIMREDTEPTKIETTLFGIPIPGMTKKSMRLKPKTSAAPAETKQTAPPAAIEYLRAHPEAKAAFKEKYGYLP